MRSNSGGGFGEFIRMIREALDEAMDPSLGSPTGERAPRRERPPRQERSERRQRVATVDVETVPQEEQDWQASERRRDDEAQERREQRAIRTPPRPRAFTGDSLRAELHQRDSARRAIVLTEVLGPPRGLQRRDQQRPGGW